MNQDRRSPTGFQILRDVVTLVLIPIGLFMASILLSVRDDIILIKHKLEDHDKAVTKHNEVHVETDKDRERIHHGITVNQSCINCMGGARQNGSKWRIDK